ncbi:hypothetical protein ACFQ5N_01255 [Lutibacter holmesii]|uniref:Uncharacterized protein n=1 Tax=Lutibacter holmesii TaxID=1137985 RepID=A0ABW3WLU9_9FLAO
MKKGILYILAVFLITLTFTSCKAKKGGCGLTSDAQKIEQINTVNKPVIVANVK